MFGTLRLARKGLSEEQRADYSAHFCGACHALRDLGGRPASLLTNYDQTVLALVLGALDPGASQESAPCTALPWRKVRVQMLSPDARSLVAALDIAAVQAKLCDDIEDEGLWTRRAALRLLRSRAARASGELRRLGFRVELFDTLASRQGSLERRTRVTLQELAAPTAELTGEMFAHTAIVTGRAKLVGLLRTTGKALGRFIYAWDAVLDLDEDLRKGRFNAIDRCYGSGPWLVPVGLYLHVQLDVLDRAFAAILLGRRGLLLAHLAQTLRMRVSTRIGDPANLRRVQAQAGDCDCGACDCDVCDCSCCGDSASETSGLQCGDTHCTLCDCCWFSGRDSGKGRGKRRRSKMPTDADDPPHGEEGRSED